MTTARTALRTTFIFIFRALTNNLNFLNQSKTRIKWHLNLKLIYCALVSQNFLIIWLCNLLILNVLKIKPKRVMRTKFGIYVFITIPGSQALVSFKKYMPPPLPYFKVNIRPLPLPHFASIFFAYLWSFRWPNYIVTLPRYFSFRLPHLNINTGHPSDELEGNIQRKSHFLFFSQWNGYNHFRFALDFSYAFGIL